ncbi:hypothetical protein HPB51_003174 [Rhipicephalus microplus]|uniref:THAP-type domain-containing protein n=1 Tax=Rhipicephalus microplus TaxID=6941 RepID=A0A9J6EKS6_RHIMP|nr:hypothetical protein HPB51_003174 [Rhipicephalus microplus]
MTVKTCRYDRCSSFEDKKEKDQRDRRSHPSAAVSRRNGANNRGIGDLDLRKRWRWTDPALYRTLKKSVEASVIPAPDVGGHGGQFRFRSLEALLFFPKLDCTETEAISPAVSHIEFIRRPPFAFSLSRSSLFRTRVRERGGCAPYFLAPPRSSLAYRNKRGPMIYCCVPFCRSSKNKKQPGVIFHEFPSDPVTRQRWLKAVARENVCPKGASATSVVCCLHFTAEDYADGPVVCRNLKAGAVPSVFPGRPPWCEPPPVQRAASSRVVCLSLIYSRPCIRLRD